MCCTALRSGGVAPALVPRRLLQPAEAWSELRRSLSAEADEDVDAISSCGSSRVSLDGSATGAVTPEALVAAKPGNPQVLP